MIIWLLRKEHVHGGSPEGYDKYAASNTLTHHDSQMRGTDQFVWLLQLLAYHGGNGEDHDVATGRIHACCNPWVPIQVRLQVSRRVEMRTWAWIGGVAVTLLRVGDTMGHGAGALDAHVSCAHDFVALSLPPRFLFCVFLWIALSTSLPGPFCVFSSLSLSFFFYVTSPKLKPLEPRRFPGPVPTPHDPSRRERRQHRYMQS